MTTTTTTKTRTMTTVACPACGERPDGNMFSFSLQPTGYSCRWCGTDWYVQGAGLVCPGDTSPRPLVVLDRSIYKVELPAS